MEIDPAQRLTTTRAMIELIVSRGSSLNLTKRLLHTLTRYDVVVLDT